MSRSEQEFRPGRDVSLDATLTAYRERATATDATVRSLALTRSSDPDGWAVGKDLGGCSFIS